MTLNISAVTAWLVTNSWPKLDGERRGDHIIYHGCKGRHWTLSAHPEQGPEQFLTINPGDPISSGHLALTANAAGVVEAVDLQESYSGHSYASALAPEQLSIQDLPALIKALHASFTELDRCLDANQRFTDDVLQRSLLNVNAGVAAQFACPHEDKEGE